MKIYIISVGKIKEKYLEEGIKEYVKRLSRYSTIEMIEVKDEQAPENLSDKDIDIIKNAEGKRILDKISSSYVISLAIQGKQIDSVALSELIIDIQNYNASAITFVIGGSLGLSDEILEKSDYLLSFSKMTFPHQLMRLILLEQVYRAFRIINNEPYHK